jgi:hypothetical protein
VKQILSPVLSLFILLVVATPVSALVTSGQIARNAVTASKIAANSVGASEIAAGAVGTSELATNAVRAGEIATGAVKALEIAPNSVGYSELATWAVTTIKLADNSVTSAKIVDGTITYADIDSINFDNTGDLHLTALGYQAGNAIEATGVDNTLVGFQAGGAITTGTGNTAVGSQALDANTTANYNTAIGYDALGTNVLGHSNTAIGYNAMALNSGSGNMNVAIGRNALDASTNGVWNVAVGYGTLGNGPNVDSSVALGYLALSLATGDNNIGIGYQAGNSITSGASNIAIGYDADVPSATSNNQLNIGGLIWGDLSGGYLAIGGSAIPTDAVLQLNQTGTVPHLELNPIASVPTTDVTTGDIYMDTDGILYIRSLSVWATANTAADFSELIVPIDFGKATHDGALPYAGDIEAGDLVVINEDGYYERSSTPYDSSIAGVESGDRGRFRLKAGSFERAEGQRQVGMMGHILVKVSLENGPIKPGDPLTTSSTPGHAMKTTRPGQIVGRALGSFDGSEGYTGMIEVLINPGWFGGI